MIRKTNEISDVWRLVSEISESDFSFLNSDKVLSIYNDGEREELLITKVEVAEKWRDGYIVNENQFYSGGKLDLIYNENTFKVITINDDQLLVKYIDYEKEKISYGIFNFSLKNIDWIVGFGGPQPRLFLRNKNIISTTDQGVKSFDINNHNEWENSYVRLTGSYKANLHTRILDSGDKLFLGIDGNENRGIYVLNVDNGDVLKKFDTESYEIFKDGGYIYTTKFKNILCRINTQTLELESWNCNTLVTENGFRSIHDHRCDVVQGKFCFTQSIGDDKAKLGVLDWEKKELVYKHDFEPKNGAIGSIHVNENRMFVHTQDNTLHIFKAE